MGLFLGYQLFYSTGPYAHPMPGLHCLNDSSFVVGFENGQYKSPPLFFFKDGLAILG